MEFRVSIFEQFLNQPSIRGPLDPILDTLLLLLFSQKALALFSLLFGLGLAIQFDRLRENPYRLRLLLRRLTALLAIGLLHLLLIWNGDILTEYAVAGFIVLPFLWGPRWLSAAAAAAFLSLYLIMPFLPVIVALPTQAWIMQHIAEATRAYGQGGLPKYSRSDSMRYQPFSRCISSFSHAPLRSSYLEHSSGGRVFCARSMHTRLLGVLAAILLPVGLGLSALHEGLTPFNRSSLGVLWFMIERSAPVILALGYAATVLALIAAGGWRLFAGQRLSGGCIHQLSAPVADLRLDLLRIRAGIIRLGIAAASAMRIGVYAFQVLLSRWWLRRFRFGRRNGCGAPSCTGQSSRCASVRHKDQKPALETGFLPSSIAP